jgi:hypothetical protein
MVGDNLGDNLRASQAFRSGVIVFGVETARIQDLVNKTVIWAMPATIFMGKPFWRSFISLYHRHHGA